jgi:hypothetical protein
MKRRALNAYLVHVPSVAELKTIATAGIARVRIANYAQRLTATPMKRSPDLMTGPQRCVADHEIARGCFRHRRVANAYFRRPRAWL